MSEVIEKYKNKLPKSYLDFISKEKRFFGVLGGDFDCYIDVWDESQMDEMWNGYKFSECLDDIWFPIGSNGGGEMIAIRLTAEKRELFFLPFIGMSREEPIYFCESFSSLYEAMKITKNEKS
jgi:hypothetical protein